MTNFLINACNVKTPIETKREPYLAIRFPFPYFPQTRTMYKGVTLD